MRNYIHYQSEDFVQDPYFRKWVLGQLPPDDQFWPSWLHAHPQQADDIERARSLVVAFRCDDRPDDPAEIRTAIDRIMADADTPRGSSSGRLAAWKIAAAVLLMLGAGLWWYTRSVQRNVLAVQTTEEYNPGPLPRAFRLKDSSIVTLFPQSRLRVSEAFGEKKREVWLTGEAFFEVARNAGKPFFVYTGEVVTKVLGTSFRVRAFASDARVSVAVSTGKVTVFKQSAEQQPGHALKDEIILTPNQQGVYVKSDEKLLKTLVDTPAIVSSGLDSNYFNFNETPLPQVFGRLEKAYGVRIVFDEELLKECNFTARLNAGALFEKLSLVCETIRARYEVVDGQVIVYASGCQ